MKTLVVAPHPDDEVLGVGGTLFRRKEEGHTLGWLIVTSINARDGWTEKQVAKRKQEVQEITRAYSFSETFQLELPTTQLDVVPMKELVGAISAVFASFQPNEVFVPHCGDVHSDHQVVFKAVTSSSKWFRNPSINRILAYETPSETDFGLNPNESFSPNVFIDISPYLKQKIDAMRIYESELGQHPFPRSEESIRALATIRGASSGFEFAEAFQLLRERM
jgi:LmbE family N-acetylglucosaminyl deacetylase